MQTSEPVADEDAIRATMASYNEALNSGDTARVLPLHTVDGIFMAPFSESSVGIDEVRAAYDAVFRELDFAVEFLIREIVQVSPSYAFVRTNSSGTTGHASSGERTAEANQELFVLRRDEDAPWRIARYSFSPTSPPTVTRR